MGEKIRKGISEETKLVFIGTNGCDFTAKADVILPTTTFLEKEGLYMNLEGRIQKTKRAITGPALVRDTAKILQVLTKRVLPSEKLFLLEKFNYEMVSLINKPIFVETQQKNSLSSISRLPFSPFLTDFYISDSLSKYST